MFPVGNNQLICKIMKKKFLTFNEFFSFLIYHNFLHHHQENNDNPHRKFFPMEHNIYILCIDILLLNKLDLDIYSIQQMEKQF